MIIGTGTQNAVLGFAAATGTDFSIRDTSNNQILSILENKEITDTSLGNTGQVLRVTANSTHLEFGQASTLTIDETAGNQNSVTNVTSISVHQ